ncbi:MAG: phytochelatin synthase family protein [Pseudomonadota bacterium]
MIRQMIRSYLYLDYYFHRITGTGAFGSRAAGPVAESCHEIVNPVKQALYRHFVFQYHESSCSVASVVAAINTLLDVSGNLDRPPVTQKEILETVREGHWKERMGENGYKGRRGLPLHTLGQVVRASLDAYGFSHAGVETVQASGDSRQSRQIRSRLMAHLLQFETSGNCLIIAHFDQGSYVPELHIPHISPVGGFDPVSRMVTILDVDPSQANPYRIPFDLFYQGLSSNYHNLFKPFGYGRGGYIFIRFR